MQGVGPRSPASLPLPPGSTGKGLTLLPPGLQALASSQNLWSLWVVGCRDFSNPQQVTGASVGPLAVSPAWQSLREAWDGARHTAGLRAFRARLVLLWRAELWLTGVAGPCAGLLSMCNVASLFKICYEPKTHLISSRTEMSTVSLMCFYIDSMLKLNI